MVKKDATLKRKKNFVFSSILKARNIELIKEMRNPTNLVKIVREFKNYLVKEYNGHMQSNISKSNNTCFELNKLKRIKNKNRKIYFDVTALRNIISKSVNFLSLKEIKEEYLRIYPNCKFSLETLRKCLNIECQIKFESVEIINRKSTIECCDDQLLAFSKILNELYIQNHLILYCDESSFNDICHRKKIWNDCKIRKSIQKPGRIKSVSVMGSISKNGLEHFKTSNTSFKSDDFVDFLNQLEEKIANKTDYMDKLEHGEITIICDNARIHTNKKNLKKLAKMKMNIVFQPAYTPQVNCIELLWGLIKKKKAMKNLKTK